MPRSLTTSFREISIKDVKELQGMFGRTYTIVFTPGSVPGQLSVYSNRYD